MPRLVLLRHGQSVWNRERRFTGWADVELTPRGRAEARAVGQLLRARGFVFDMGVTSYLGRASETLQLVLAEMGLSGIPIQQSWRLNERHYGVLQGLRWHEAVERYGLTQVLRWQRHFTARPPALDPTDARFPGHDPRYAALAPTALPRGESLHDTLERLLPYWHDTIVPVLRQGKQVLIVAHGNSLRGLRKYLEKLSATRLLCVTVPTATPLVYDLDDAAKPLRWYALRPPFAWRRWLPGTGRTVEENGAARGRG
ncbi:MAG: 2,3-bisphosphoglycerate-dependent phosphoglycerate mutase [Candidatus Binatia bacterium]|nr:2,3-bisphosphoglycerate-dependent phosphoglycerate mutase [Candidatus Binatia bacterium]